MRKYFRQVVVLFGLLGAGLVLTYFFTLHFLGSNPLIDMKRLDILIILMCELFAMGYFRDRYNKRTLNFWEGLAIGACVALISTLLASITIYAFIQINPEVLTGFIKHMEAVIRTDFAAGKISNRGDFENLIRNLPFITPFAEVFSIFLTDLFLSLVATIILAMIMRRGSIL